LRRPAAAASPCPVQPGAAGAAPGARRRAIAAADDTTLASSSDYRFPQPETCCTVLTSLLLLRPPPSPATQGKPWLRPAFPPRPRNTPPFRSTCCQLLQSAALSSLSRGMRGLQPPRHRVAPPSAGSGRLQVFCRLGFFMGACCWWGEELAWRHHRNVGASSCRRRPRPSRGIHFFFFELVV